MLSTSRHKVRGVSLIEVLVSILIAAVGLLALAGANVSSVRYTKMSQYRGTATQLANDIGERIRANKAGLASYALTTSFSAQASVPTLTSGELCNSYAIAPCTAAAIANYDLKTWRILVRNQLPEGSAYIAVQAVQSAADVWLVWRDPSVGNADDSPTKALECPNALSVGADPSVRCSYFRINL
jgi:type IV pilus assembly protein PilV